MYNRAIDISLLLLRLGFGGIMMFSHGWPKLMKFFDGDPSKFPDPLGVGAELSLGLTVFSEFFCSILLMAGMFTRIALVPLIITMLVAMLIVHSGDSFGDRESSVIYLIAYLALFIAGPGWFSLDGRFRNEI